MCKKVMTQSEVRANIRARITALIADDSRWEVAQLTNQGITTFMDLAPNTADAVNRLADAYDTLR